jgi:hypothetical protein
MEYNRSMKCAHPQHTKKNQGKPVPIPKKKFERKCSGKNKKEPKMCRWVQWSEKKFK